jgi:hypothetical protein
MQFGPLGVEKPHNSPRKALCWSGCEQGVEPREMV